MYILVDLTALMVEYVEWLKAMYVLLSFVNEKVFVCIFCHCVAIFFFNHVLSLM